MFNLLQLTNIIILTAAFAAGWFSVQRLRNTSGLYTVRLLPFAIYSLASWGLWIVIYVLSSFLDPAGFLNDPVRQVLHWVGLVQSVCILAAVAILYSRRPHRWSVSLPIVICFVLVAALLIFATSYHRSEVASWLEVLIWTAAFWAFIPALRRLRLGWAFILPFLLYGFVQLLGLALPRSGGPQLVFASTIPLLRAMLLIAWTRIMNKLVSTGEKSRELARMSMKESIGVDYLGSNFNVMISSTVTDLSPERDAVDRAIRSLNLDRFRAEAFGSVPRTPRVVCEFMARACDLFILIVGERYGYVISPEKISIVEHEYNTAHQENPGKILVYVKSFAMRDVQEQNFLERIENFDHGYFRSTFDTPEQLFDCVRRDIARWLAQRAKAAQISA